jgi:transposase
MNKKKVTKVNKKHTAEFKQEAIKLAEKTSVAEAAEKLGVYASQIYNWKTAIKSKQNTTERESGLAAENARLKRQLAEQAEELEILKKAATYFAKQQK